MTIRTDILKQLRTRLQQIDGWSVQIARMPSNERDADASVHAFIEIVGEDKSVAGNDSYQCTMQVAVDLLANVEDADADIDEGNPLLYIDRLVAEIEKSLHSPDSWGAEPAYADAYITGHAIAPPDESSNVEARVALTFQYRHSYRDPSQP